MKSGSTQTALPGNAKAEIKARVAVYLVLITFLLFSADLFAAGDPLTNALQEFVNWPKSGLGIALASAILIAIGVAWAFNKIHFGWVIGYCVGMAFIFGGQNIVNMIRGWVG